MRKKIYWSEEFKETYLIGEPNDPTIKEYISVDALKRFAEFNSMKGALSIYYESRNDAMDMLLRFIESD